MSLLVNGPLAVVLGVAAFFFAPVIAGGRLSDWYVELAMHAIDRGLFVKRATSGYALKAARYDAEVGAEKVIINGDPHYFEDPNGYMSRLKNKPFGVALERRGVIVTPRVADMGRELRRRKRNGDWTDEQGRRAKWFDLDPGRTLVNLDDALAAVQGSASPRLATVVKEFTKKGQAGFNTSRAMTYTVWLFMFGAGGAAPVLLSKVGGAVGTDTVSVPIQLAPTVVPYLSVVVP
ncbi:MAG: hypothetical protein ACNS61_05555 [Candidatus Wenzhouxiangella sp. M2_3B_020]